MIETTFVLVLTAFLLSEKRVRRALPNESVAAFIATAGALGLLFVTRKF